MATEIINERLLYPSYEIIGGEKFMAPAPTLDHTDIIGRIHFLFVNYFLIHKNGYVYHDNADVHLADGSLCRPDLSVVLKPNEQIVASRKAIHGAPDMVVEVLSYSTRKKDLTIKKDTYEAQGVREYWIVDPQALPFTSFATANTNSTTFIFSSMRRNLKLSTTKTRRRLSARCPCRLSTG